MVKKIKVKDTGMVDSDGKSLDGQIVDALIDNQGNAQILSYRGIFFYLINTQYTIVEDEKGQNTPINTIRDLFGQDMKTIEFK